MSSSSELKEDRRHHLVRLHIPINKEYVIIYVQVCVYTVISTNYPSYDVLLCCFYVPPAPPPPPPPPHPPPTFYQPHVYMLVCVAETTT